MAGLPMDDFCLASLFYAYGNAKPKQQRRAQEVFEQFVADGAKLSQTTIQALQRVVGRSEAQVLCQKYSKQPSAQQRSTKGAARGFEKTSIRPPPGLEQDHAAVINVSAYDWE